MSSQRIRYSQVSGNIFRSRRNFLTSTGQTVQVELDLDNKKYRVVDSITNEEVATGGNTRNIAVLKIQAKKGLTGLGIEFTEETRYRVGDSINEDARQAYSAANRGE